MNANQSTCHSGDGTKGLNRLPYLAEPLLRFDLAQELRELRRKDSWGRETGRSSKTLAKYPDFRIVLVLMKAATHMDEHGPRPESRFRLSWAGSVSICQRRSRSCCLQENCWR